MDLKLYPEYFIHNAHAYELEYAGLYDFIIITLTLLPVEKHGPYVYRFKKSFGALIERPILPPKLYDESIVAHLKEFALLIPEIQNMKPQIAYSSCKSISNKL